MGIGTERCKADGCTSSVSEPGHELCLAHWKSQRAGHLARGARCSTFVETKNTPSDKPTLCTTCLAASPSHEDADDAPAGFLSSTRLGQHFGLSSVKINLILAELGWIEKYVKGWTPTDRGSALGANVKEMRNGTPYVVWPSGILNNAALNDSIEEQQPDRVQRSGTPHCANLSTERDEGTTPSTELWHPDPDFRGKFPAEYRTQDGHQVRSRAEAMMTTGST